jgi:hypothetical protein
MAIPDYIRRLQANPYYSPESKRSLFDGRTPMDQLPEPPDMEQVPRKVPPNPAELERVAAEASRYVSGEPDVYQPGPGGGFSGSRVMRGSMADIRSRAQLENYFRMKYPHYAQMRALERSGMFLRGVLH